MPGTTQCHWRLGIGGRSTWVKRITISMAHWRPGSGEPLFGPTFWCHSWRGQEAKRAGSKEELENGIEQNWGMMCKSGQIQMTSFNQPNQCWHWGGWDDTGGASF